MGAGKRKRFIYNGRCFGIELNGTNPVKKYFLALTFLFLTSVAQAGVYVSGGGGIGFGFSSKTADQNTELKYDNSSVSTAAVGYAFPIVCFEVEGVHNKSNMKNTNRSMTANLVFANTYARIPFIGLYAGAGVGYGSVRHKSTTAYQGMLGLEYGIGMVHLGMEYRHFQSSKKIREANEISDLSIDALLLKLRLEF